MDETRLTIDLDNDYVFYHVKWGDSIHPQVYGPYPSGKEVVLNHTWHISGTFRIKAKARDVYGGESDWTTLTVTMPCSYNKPVLPFLEWLFERFPNAFPLLRQLKGY